MKRPTRPGTQAELFSPQQDGRAQLQAQLHHVDRDARRYTRKTGKKPSKRALRMTAVALGSICADCKREDPTTTIVFVPNATPLCRRCRGWRGGR